MMYPYIRLSDETNIVHSETRSRNGHDYVEVHFERPCDWGFCSARCELPSYKWLFNDGFSEDEIDFFTEFLEHNAHSIIKFSKCGGLQIA